MSPTKPFELITDPDVPAQPGELTPTCFTIFIEQDQVQQEHTLWVEIRDWLQQDVGSVPRVAETTSLQQITFTVTDITNGRYTLPGRDGP